MSILVLDNYDSFTYNLVHVLEKLTDQEVVVRRNDEISIEYARLFDRMVLSPGPGIPSEAGMLLEVIRNCHRTSTILGVCLGHQAIAEAFGGKLYNLPQVQHGISTPINVDPGCALFRGFTGEMMVGRYHSWVVDSDLPPGFVPTASDQDGTVMAMMHTSFKMHSVQFHPESVLTPLGEQIISNWLNYC